MKTLEKILLLLSYFLFWEYFVISRSYVLIALIAFTFIILRERRPQPEFILWLLLGLLANVHVFGAIWSMVLAAALATERIRCNSLHVAGVALYAVLLVFAELREPGVDALRVGDRQVPARVGGAHVADEAGD